MAKIFDQDQPKSAARAEPQRGVRGLRPVDGRASEAAARDGHGRCQEPGPDAAERPPSTLTPEPAGALSRGHASGPQAVEKGGQRLPRLGPAAAGSSARATYIATSSSAPISAWARGLTGWRRIAPASIAACEGALDQAQPVAAGDLAPALPAEHGRRVEQDDPLHLRLHAVVEEHLGARAQRLDRVGAAASAPAAISSVTSASICS